MSLLSSLISFDGEWLDELLAGNKQQTTRKKTDRFNIGDVCTLFNQQHEAILSKPLRKMTLAGIDAIYHRGYPMIEEFRQARYHAHLLGTVVITGVNEIHPSGMSDMPLNEWAVADGFPDFDTARCWFENRYGSRWMRQTWTVISWQGWQHRYFEPGADAALARELNSPAAVKDFEEVCRSLGV